MKKTLTFAIDIAAPRALVWDTMLDPEGYKAWTAAFCEGSHFAGSWDEGAAIRFLAPNGDGMVAEIAANRPHEFVSIRHLGEINMGAVDTSSDKVRSWAPAYENYTFSDRDGGTFVEVALDTVPEYVPYMENTFPKALELLKRLCEDKAGR